MILSVTYSTPQDLVRDHDQQLRRGGLLVRIPPPEGLDLYADVPLRLRAAEAEVTLKGRLVQIFPGVGVAITFEVAELGPLVPAIERARTEGEREGPESVHEVVVAEPAGVGAAPARAPAAPATNRIQQAIHGNRDERTAILRDVNSRSIHGYVLRNPHIQLDEVTAMAKNAQMSSEVLKAIAERQEWASLPQIAIALVRNPKTPIPVAVRLVDAVSPTDLRFIAKDGHTRAPIAAAARKKLGGAR